MRLKSLQLHGFKTFADRTEITFSEGVTAVVGPNGSGKSNVGDAILWVMGEQKASAIRGTKNSDVIFAGSDKRRPMGMAEVSLTVDNSDGALPVEFSEVTITRRAYRTGEGEYFLNKVPCRLKDIYELFLDTGVGREAYSFVNQREIDAVLSVNPEDRRGLFEEAAGIKKYRVKKREALRKLEATEANLLRVRDILSEFDGRLEPLRLQAERAERFVHLRDRLRAIESNLLIVDLRFAQSEMNAAQKAREAAEQNTVEHDDKIEAAESQALQIAELLTQAEAALEAARAQHQAALTRVERAESGRALAVQRAEGLAASQELRAQELEGLSARREQLAARLQETERELAAIREEEGALRADVAQRQAQVQAVADQIAQLTRQGERRRSEALNLARQHAARQADLARAEARVAEVETSLPGLQQEAERLTAALAGQSAAVEQARQDAEQARARLAEAADALNAAAASRDAARQAVQAAQAKVNDAASQRMGVATRLRTLQDLEAAQEGYYQGVKAVFDAKKQGRLSGEYTVVADAFITPPGYETALETALGGSLQDIITATESEAKAAIDFLHHNRAGRATFLPLSRMRPSRDSLDLSRAKGLRGVLGAALEIIDYKPAFKPALDVLLGRVFFCETLDDALRASQEARGWSRVVTLNGELVSPTGAMTGGRQQGRGNAHILSRKTEIASLQKEAAAKEKDEEAARRQLAGAEQARDEADVRLSEAQNAKQAAHLAVSEAGRQNDFVASELRRLEAQRGQALQRLESAQNNRLQAKEQAAKAAEALASAGVETADSDEAMAAEAGQVQKLTVERDGLQVELTTVRIALATVSEKTVSLDRALRALRAEADQVRQHEERQQQAGRNAQAEHDALIAQTAERDAEAAQAREALTEAVAGLESRQTARQVLLAQSESAGAELRTWREARTVALDAVHKNELREARLEAQRNQLAARLYEEYEIGMDQALALAEDPEVTDGMPQEVSRLRREIRQMGDVNTGAIEEYEQMAARHEFLTTQRADLEEARAKLLDAIKDIDASTRGVFMDTFRAVAQAFDGLFMRLFGGGKTELHLTRPDDILETGIEIVVQPPGKKRQNLALLSGGERALTAAALLFAFLQVKPSPFVVMDEVDAPLDGANVERFADLLREFGERSQFIIITHNPTTMEAAPIWYGITMQEPGISRVLSMQVPHIPTEETHADGRAKKNGHHAETVLA